MVWLISCFKRINVWYASNSTGRRGVNESISWKSPTSMDEFPSQESWVQETSEQLFFWCEGKTSNLLTVGYKVDESFLFRRIIFRQTFYDLYRANEILILIGLLIQTKILQFAGHWPSSLPVYWPSACFVGSFHMNLCFRCSSHFRNTLCVHE